MKLLLTSNGISNDKLARELECLASQKFNELKIAFIPTAGLYGSGDKDWMILDMYRLHKRGAEVDVVDVAQLPNAEINERLLWSDVIFVGGGNPFYLSYCFEKAGMFDLLPRLLETRVYAGISAGSMIASKTLRTSSEAYKSDKFYDESYDEFGPDGRSSMQTLAYVDFAFRPHLNSRYFPDVTKEKMQALADNLKAEMYVCDDETAVSINDSSLAVVGEGKWHVLRPGDKT